MVRKEENDPVDDLKAIKEAIVSRCKELGGTGNAEMMALLKSYVASGNPNAIRDIAKAKELLEKLFE